MRWPPPPSHGRGAKNYLNLRDIIYGRPLDGFNWSEFKLKWNVNFFFGNFLIISQSIIAVTSFVTHLTQGPTPTMANGFYFWLRLFFKSLFPSSRPNKVYTTILIRIQVECDEVLLDLKVELFFSKPKKGFGLKKKLLSSVTALVCVVFNVTWTKKIILHIIEFNTDWFSNTFVAYSKQFTTFQWRT